MPSKVRFHGFEKAIMVRAQYNGPNDKAGKIPLKHGERYDIFVKRNAGDSDSDYDVAVYVMGKSKFAVIGYGVAELAWTWGKDVAKAYFQVCTEKGENDAIG